MTVQLVRQIVSAFYSDHERIVIEAFLRCYTDGDESISIDEDKLNDIVNVKACTLRAALAQLQSDQLLYTQMTQRGGEKYAVRTWVLDFPEFKRVVRARLQYVRNELTSNVQQAAAHCEICDRPAALEELHSGFSCVVCNSPLVDPTLNAGPAPIDLACVQELEQMVN